MFARQTKKGQSPRHGHQLVQSCAAIREPGAFSVSLELLALSFGSCSAPSLTFNQYGGREELGKYFRNTEARDQASDVGLGGMLRNDVGDWTQSPRPPLGDGAHSKSRDPCMARCR